MTGKMVDESKKQYFDRISQMTNEDMINELSVMSEYERNQFQSFMVKNIEKYKEKALKAHKDIEKLEKEEKRLQQECARLQSNLKD